MTQEGRTIASEKIDFERIKKTGELEDARGEIIPGGAQGGLGARLRARAAKDNVNEESVQATQEGRTIASDEPMPNLFNLAHENSAEAWNALDPEAQERWKALDALVERHVNFRIQHELSNYAHELVKEPPKAARLVLAAVRGAWTSVLEEWRR